MEGDKMRIGDKVFVPGLGQSEVKDIFPGHNRVVFLAANGDTQKVIKVFGESVEINLQDMGAFCQCLLNYRQALEKANVPVPTQSETQIIINTNRDSGKLNVTEISPFFGKGLEDELLQAGPKKCQVITRMILGSIKGLLKKTLPNTPLLLQVGIDLIPRNFTLNTALHYVDLVPPKIWLKGKFLLEIPEPQDKETIQLGIWRHYSKKGIFQVLLVQLCKLRPELKPLFEKEIISFLEQAGEKEVLNFFSQRPALLQDPKKLILLAQNLGFPELYTLRDIACQLCFLGKLSQNQLAEIFVLSHFTSQPLSERKMKAIKQILRNCL